jgi:hypothetical protein
MSWRSGGDVCSASGPKERASSGEGRARIVKHAGIASLIIIITTACAAALGASSAVALPEVGRCVAQSGTGKYKNANCTEKAGSKTFEKQFEFVKNAIAKKFTSAGGESVLETTSGSKFVCKTESASGEYRESGSPPRTREVHGVLITFTRCETPDFAQCNSKGGAAGEFTTAKLSGKLGYISGKGTKAPVVGQELHPEVSKGVFLAFECLGGAIHVEVRQGSGKGGDCIIARVANSDEMSSSFEETYSASKGVQSPQHFEGSSHICNLESNTNGGAFERSTLAFGTTITNEEALEIKA